jgi:hypothetical protein
MPVLRSHVLGGKAVLPTAIIIEWLAHGAIHGNPGLQLAGLDDLRILRGVKLDADATVKAQVLAGPAVWRDGEAVVPVELRSDAVLHARASVILAAQPSQPPASRRLSLPPLPRPVADFYNKRDLFHGPALHAIAAITGCDAAGVSGAATAAPPPSRWMREPIRSAWLTDPMVIDAVFQLVIVWSQVNRGHGSLPTGVARYRQFQRRFPAAGAAVHVRITRAADHAAWADVDIVDTTGRLVASLDGCQCVIDAALREAFSRNQLPERVEA